MSAEEQKPPEQSFGQMPASVNPPEFYFEVVVSRKKVGTDELLDTSVQRVGHNFLLIGMEMLAATPEQIASKRVPIGFSVKSNFLAHQSKEEFGGIFSPLMGFMSQYYNSCIEQLKGQNKITIAGAGTRLPSIPINRLPPFRPPQRRK